MVKNYPHDPGAIAAERKLIFSYAPPGARAALAVLLALDARLGDIVRTTREPMVGQMRLTWWHAALTALDDAPAPAEPLLDEIARAILPLGVRGRDLAGLIDGWEVLLDGAALDDPALERFATGRGGRLFALAATLAGGAVPTMAAGEGWALADLATHVSDPATAARAAAAARRRLANVTERRWPVAVRALGALALLARYDVADPPVAAGSARRTFRLLRHRLTGA